MSDVLDAVFIFPLMLVGMFLFITGLLAMAGGNNMERIGLSTPRRGKIAMVVGVIISTFGTFLLT
ncbi:MAG: hypothetical protein OXG98_02540 [Gemmatimonadetes bacterium]|nr:hypothetical protein [Gemmatimonadota bacterium]